MHFATKDDGWWRQVADFSRSKATIEEAEAMCAALNKGSDIK